MATRAYNASYYQANKEHLKAKAKVRAAKRRLEKPEECRLAVERWHKDPANADKRRTYYREVVAKSDAWKRAYKKYQNKSEVKALRNARDRKRAITRLMRMPAWLTAEQVDQINCIYQISAISSEVMGRYFHVDHMIPLHGTKVSGLHVPWNLQILTEKNNLRKGNKFHIT